MYGLGLFIMLEVGGKSKVQDEMYCLIPTYITFQARRAVLPYGTRVRGMVLFSPVNLINRMDCEYLATLSIQLSMAFFPTDILMLQVYIL